MHGSKDGYVRIREQARVQVAGRNQRQPLHEVLEITDQHGLTLLPEPSSGDVFFDIEGDPFVGRGGREYLFGLVFADSVEPKYAGRWALTLEEEKLAFEWFVDTVMERWARDPKMHIYHFAPYEPSAVKRLMGRHGTREDEIDRMLRAKLFVDLHTVLKRSVRASVEQYSLKAMEQFHRFKRRVPLEDAGKAMRQMQHALELGHASEVDAPVRDAIEFYNADDCYSTLSLREWLEQVRTNQEQTGHSIVRPAMGDGAPSEAVSERQQRTAELAERLRGGVSEDPEQRDEEQNMRWLLSNLLEWHRRESKVEWWEYFRLADLTDEDLLDERAAVSGLEFVGTIEVARKIPTDRYSFEKQETSVRAGDDVRERGDKIGTVAAMDVLKRTIDIKKMKKTADRHPNAVFVDGRGPKTDVQADALYRLGAWVAENGADASGAHRAARDLLLQRPPRLLDGSTLAPHIGQSTVDVAKRIGIQLNNSVLAIQGPPGAGKTFRGRA